MCIGREIMHSDKVLAFTQQRFGKPSQTNPLQMLSTKGVNCVVEIEAVDVADDTH